MLTLKNVMIVILLILASALSSWSIFVSKKTPIVSSAKSTEPDAFMENITATIINKQGVRTLSIESPRMVHYADNDATVIESPHITIYRDSPEPWHINSNFAKATQGMDKIYFWNNVVIHHPNDGTTPVTTFKTNSLTVFPHEKTAATNDQVVLTQPETVVYAVGMKANLNDGEVQLLSQARGEYVPTP